MKTTLIQKLASKIGSAIFHRENDSENSEALFLKFESEAEEIVKNEFPSGSGVDSGTKIDWECTTKNQIVLNADFHHMDDNGYYDDWTEHNVVIKPDWTGINLKVTGKDKRQIKEYLADLFYEVCQRPIE